MRWREAYEEGLTSDKMKDIRRSARLACFRELHNKGWDTSGPLVNEGGWLRERIDQAIGQAEAELFTNNTDIHHLDDPNLRIQTLKNWLNQRAIWRLRDILKDDPPEPLPPLGNGNGLDGHGSDEPEDAEQQVEDTYDTAQARQAMLLLMVLARENTDRGQVAKLLLKDRENGCANVVTGTGSGFSPAAIEAILDWEYNRVEVAVRELRDYARSALRHPQVAET